MKTTDEWMAETMQPILDRIGGMAMKEQWSWDGLYPITIRDGGGYTVCSMFPSRAAHARLIMAAPDLLDACVELLAEYGALHAHYNLGECDGSLMARAAIAKATGADHG